MNRPVVTATLLVMLAAVCRCDAAESGGMAAKQYRVTRWTVENGLPQNSVKALAQTADGYLWVGTLKGLARFDGWRFRVFDHETNPEFTHDSINALAVDKRDGGLWISTGRELIYYREHRFTRYAEDLGINAGFGVMAPALDGGVWYSRLSGRLALFQGGKLQTFAFANEDKSNTVFQISQEIPGKVLMGVGSPGGGRSFHLFDLKTETMSALAGPPGVPSPEPPSEAYFRAVDAAVWLWRPDGVWRRRSEEWTRMSEPYGSNRRWPQEVFVASTGEVWLKYHWPDRDVLLRLNDSKIEDFVAPGFPAYMGVGPLLEDGEGSLWVGSTTGLFRLQSKRIKVYSRADGLANDDVLAVTTSADGAVWLGTQRGVGRIQDGRVSNVILRDPEPIEFAVGVLRATQDGRLWASWRKQGLFAYENGAWRPYDPNSMSALGEDQQGGLWCGTSEGVFGPLGDDHSKWYTPTNGLSHRDVRLIHRDRRGDLWFGTFGGGLNCLHDGKITVFKSNGSEKNNCMWWIHEDVDGVFWVATEDGLNRFVPPGVSESNVQSLKSKVEDQAAAGGAPATRHASPVTAEGRFFTFTKQHGLAEPTVNNIQEDGFGYLWLSGLKGIHRISRAELNEIAAGRRTNFTCVTFGEADGLLNSECNGGDNQPAGCKDQLGRIWFPTVEGVAVIDPKTMLRVETPPPVVIEQLRANDEVVFGDGSSRPVLRSNNAEGGREEAQTEIGHEDSRNNRASSPRLLRLKPGHARVLEIRYTANCLAAAERVTFRYRLERYDDNWHEDRENQRVAFYTNLRPNDYTFHVQARGPQGQWNEAGARLAFHVEPHFYETWPFRVGSLAAVGLVVFGLHHRRVMRIRAVQLLEQQRAVAEERARIARDLHDDLGGSLTGFALELEAARRKGRAEGEQLGSLAGEARSIAQSLRELSWATNPSCDNLGSLGVFLGEMTERFCAAAGLRCELSLPSANNALPLPARLRHDLLVLAKEALANIAKHAGASRVALTLCETERCVLLRIADDGAGFDPARVFAGNGLKNLRARLEHAGGVFEVSTSREKGTSISAMVPVRPTDPLKP